MAESKENNKALLALKECVRARAKAGSEDGFVHLTVLVALHGF